MYKKRYSYLIRPLLVLTDLLIINAVLFFVYDKEFLNIYFSSYISIFWILISLFSNYYKVYRFTKIYRIFSLLFTQLSLFVLVYFSYFGIFREGDIVNNQFLILMSILSGLTFFKFLSYYGLKLYRKEGKNYRNVVIIGQDDTSDTVAKFFLNKADLGYKYRGFFTDEPSSNEYHLGALNDSFEYIIKNSIDEIYCTISSLNKDEVQEFTKFANTHSRVIKLIPNSNELYSKNLDAEFYNNTLVLNVKRLPLDIAENRVFKRTFDIIFSSFIIVFIMSWLAPILWIFIKLESRGPALFKQDREGFGGYHFTCYKFRSMKQNKVSDLVHARKDDNRVTLVGSLMRKTSLDELPQFFNVLLGDMSVVGPRPHMSTLSLEYQKDIHNYLERHVVKPGITGLAQISGYRGEVKEKSDIKNRIRFDIFYIENWSFLLDVKIILQTAFNIFKGEEKAY